MNNNRNSNTTQDGRSYLRRNRSDGRLKTYKSSDDCRAWNLNKRERHDHISDYIASSYERFQGDASEWGRFVPVPVLVDVVVHSYKDELQKLHSKLQKVQQELLDSEKGINVTARERHEASEDKDIQVEEAIEEPVIFKGEERDHEVQAGNIDRQDKSSDEGENTKREKHAIMEEEYERQKEERERQENLPDEADSDTRTQNIRETLAEINTDFDKLMYLKDKEIQSLRSMQDSIPQKASNEEWETSFQDGYTNFYENLRHYEDDIERKENEVKDLLQNIESLVMEEESKRNGSMSKYDDSSSLIYNDRDHDNMDGSGMYERIDSQNEEFAKLKGELDILSVRLSALESSGERGHMDQYDKRREESFLNEIQDLQDSLAVCKKALKTERLEKEEVEKQLEKCIEDMSKSKKMGDEKDRELSLLKDKLNCCREEKKELELKIDTLSTSRRRSSKQLEKSEELMSDLELQHIREVKSFNEKISQMKKELKQREKDIDELQDKYQKILEQCDSLKEKNKESENDNMKSQLIVCKQKLSEIEERYQTLLEECERLKRGQIQDATEVENSKKLANEFMEKSRKCEEKNKVLRERLEKLENQLMNENENEKDLTTANEHEKNKALIDELQKQNESLKSDLENALTQLKHKTGSIDTLNETLNIMKERLEDRDKELVEMRETNEEILAEFLQLKQRCIEEVAEKDKDEKLSELEDLLMKCGEEKKNLEIEIEKCEKEFAEMKDSYQKLLQTYESKCSEEETKDQDLSQLEKMLDKCCDEKKDLELHQKELENEIAEMKENYQQQLEECQTQLKYAEEHLDQKVQELSKLNMKLKNCDDNRKELELKQQGLENELTKMRKTYENLLEEYQSLQKKEESRQGKENMLQGTLKNCQEEKKIMEVRIEEMEKELDRLQKSYQGPDEIEYRNQSEDNGRTDGKQGSQSKDDNNQRVNQTDAEINQEKLMTIIDESKVTILENEKTSNEKEIADILLHHQTCTVCKKEAERILGVDGVEKIRSTETEESTEEEQINKDVSKVMRGNSREINPLTSNKESQTVNTKQGSEQLIKNDSPEIKMGENNDVQEKYVSRDKIKVPLKKGKEGLAPIKVSQNEEKLNLVKTSFEGRIDINRSSTDREDQPTMDPGVNLETSITSSNVKEVSIMENKNAEKEIADILLHHQTCTVCKMEAERILSIANEEGDNSNENEESTQGKTDSKQDSSSLKFIDSITEDPKTISGLEENDQQDGADRILKNEEVQPLRLNKVQSFKPQAKEEGASGGNTLPGSVTSGKLSSSEVEATSGQSEKNIQNFTTEYQQERVPMGSDMADTKQVPQIKDDKNVTEQPSDTGNTTNTIEGLNTSADEKEVSNIERMNEKKIADTLLHHQTCTICKKEAERILSTVDEEGKNQKQNEESTQEKTSSKPDSSSVKLKDSIIEDPSKDGKSVRGQMIDKASQEDRVSQSTEIIDLTKTSEDSRIKSERALTDKDVQTEKISQSKDKMSEDILEQETDSDIHLEKYITIIEDSETSLLENEKENPEREIAEVKLHHQKCMECKVEVERSLHILEEENKKGTETKGNEEALREHFTGLDSEEIMSQSKGELRKDKETTTSEISPDSNWMLADQVNEIELFNEDGSLTKFIDSITETAEEIAEKENQRKHQDSSEKQPAKDDKPGDEQEIENASKQVRLEKGVELATDYKEYESIQGKSEHDLGHSRKEFKQTSNRIAGCSDDIKTEHKHMSQATSGRLDKLAKKDNGKSENLNEVQLFEFQIEEDGDVSKNALPKQIPDMEHAEENINETISSNPSKRSIEDDKTELEKEEKTDRVNKEDGPISMNNSIDTEVLSLEFRNVVDGDVSNSASSEEIQELGLTDEIQDKIISTLKTPLNAISEEYKTYIKTQETTDDRDKESETKSMNRCIDNDVQSFENRTEVGRDVRNNESPKKIQELELTDEMQDKSFKSAKSPLNILSEECKTDMKSEKTMNQDNNKKRTKSLIHSIHNDMRSIELWAKVDDVGNSTSPEDISELRHADIIEDKSIKSANITLNVISQECITDFKSEQTTDDEEESGTESMNHNTDNDKKLSKFKTEVVRGVSNNPSHEELQELGLTHKIADESIESAKILLKIYNEENKKDIKSEKTLDVDDNEKGTQSLIHSIHNDVQSFELSAIVDDFNNSTSPEEIPESRLADEIQDKRISSANTKLNVISEEHKTDMNGEETTEEDNKEEGLNSIKHSNDHDVQLFELRTEVDRDISYNTSPEEIQELEVSDEMQGKSFKSANIPLNVISKEFITGINSGKMTDDENMDLGTKSINQSLDNDVLQFELKTEVGRDVSSNASPEEIQELQLTDEMQDKSFKSAKSPMVVICEEYKTDIKREKTIDEDNNKKGTKMMKNIVDNDVQTFKSRTEVDREISRNTSPEEIQKLELIDEIKDKSIKSAMTTLNLISENYSKDMKSEEMADEGNKEPETKSQINIIHNDMQSLVLKIKVDGADSNHTSPKETPELGFADELLEKNIKSAKTTLNIQSEGYTTDIKSEEIIDDENMDSERKPMNHSIGNDMQSFELGTEVRGDISKKASSEEIKELGLSEGRQDKNVKSDKTPFNIVSEEYKTDMKSGKTMNEDNNEKGTKSLIHSIHNGEQSIEFRATVEGVSNSTLHEETLELKFADEIEDKKIKFPKIASNLIIKAYKTNMKSEEITDENKDSVTKTMNQSIDNDVGSFEISTEVGRDVSNNASTEKIQELGLIGEMQGKSIISAKTTLNLISVENITDMKSEKTTDEDNKVSGTKALMHNIHSDMQSFDLRTKVDGEVSNSASPEEIQELRLADGIQNKSITFPETPLNVVIEEYKTNMKSQETTHKENKESGTKPINHSIDNDIQSFEFRLDVGGDVSNEASPEELLIKKEKEVAPKSMNHSFLKIIHGKPRVQEVETNVVQNQEKIPMFRNKVHSNDDCHVKQGVSKIGQTGVLSALHEVDILYPHKKCLICKEKLKSVLEKVKFSTLGAEKIESMKEEAKSLLRHKNCNICREEAGRILELLDEIIYETTTSRDIKQDAKEDEIQNIILNDTMPQIKSHECATDYLTLRNKVDLEYKPLRLGQIQESKTIINLNETAIVPHNKRILRTKETEHISEVLKAEFELEVSRDRTLKQTDLNVEINVAVTGAFNEYSITEKVKHIHKVVDVLDELEFDEQSFFRCRDVKELTEITISDLSIGSESSNTQDNLRDTIFLNLENEIFSERITCQVKSTHKTQSKWSALEKIEKLLIKHEKCNECIEEAKYLLSLADKDMDQEEEESGLLIQELYGKFTSIIEDTDALYQQKNCHLCLQESRHTMYTTYEQADKECEKREQLAKKPTDELSSSSEDALMLLGNRLCSVYIEDPDYNLDTVQCRNTVQYNECIEEAKYILSTVDKDMDQEEDSGLLIQEQYGKSFSIIEDTDALYQHKNREQHKKREQLVKKPTDELSSSMEDALILFGNRACSIYIEDPNYNLDTVHQEICQKKEKRSQMARKPSGELFAETKTPDILLQHKDCKICSTEAENILDSFVTENKQGTDRVGSMTEEQKKGLHSLGVHGERFTDNQQHAVKEERTDNRQFINNVITGKIMEEEGLHATEIKQEEIDARMIHDEPSSEHVMDKKISSRWKSLKDEEILVNELKPKDEADEIYGLSSTTQKLLKLDSDEFVNELAPDEMITAVTDHSHSIQMEIQGIPQVATDASTSELVEKRYGVLEMTKNIDDSTRVDVSETQELDELSSTVAGSIGLGIQKIIDETAYEELIDELNTIPKTEEVEERDAQDKTDELAAKEIHRNAISTITQMEEESYIQQPIHILPSEEMICKGTDHSQAEKDEEEEHKPESLDESESDKTHHDVLVADQSYITKKDRESYMLKSVNNLAPEEIIYQGTDPSSTAEDEVKEHVQKSVDKLPSEEIIHKRTFLLANKGEEKEMYTQKSIDKISDEEKQHEVTDLLPNKEKEEDSYIQKSVDKVSSEEMIHKGTVSLPTEEDEGERYVRTSIDKLSTDDVTHTGIDLSSTTEKEEESYMTNHVDKLSYEEVKQEESDLLPNKQDEQERFMQTSVDEMVSEEVLYKGADYSSTKEKEGYQQITSDNLGSEEILHEEADQLSTTKRENESYRQKSIDNVVSEEMIHEVADLLDSKDIEEESYEQKSISKLALVENEGIDFLPIKEDEEERHMQRFVEELESQERLQVVADVAPQKEDEVERYMQTSIAKLVSEDTQCKKPDLSSTKGEEEERYAQTSLGELESEHMLHEVTDLQSTKEIEEESHMLKSTDEISSEEMVDENNISLTTKEEEKIHKLKAFDKFGSEEIEPKGVDLSLTKENEEDRFEPNSVAKLASEEIFHEATYLSFSNDEEEEICEQKSTDELTSKDVTLIETDQSSTKKDMEESCIKKIVETLASEEILNEESYLSSPTEEVEGYKQNSSDNLASEELHKGTDLPLTIKDEEDRFKEKSADKLASKEMLHEATDISLLKVEEDRYIQKSTDKVASKEIIDQRYDQDEKYPPDKKAGLSKTVIEIEDQTFDENIEGGVNKSEIAQDNLDKEIEKTKLTRDISEIKTAQSVPNIEGGVNKSEIAQDNLDKEIEKTKLTRDISEIKTAQSVPSKSISDIQEIPFIKQNDTYPHSSKDELAGDDRKLQEEQLTLESLVVFGEHMSDERLLLGENVKIIRKSDMSMQEGLEDEGIEVVTEFGVEQIKRDSDQKSVDSIEHEVSKTSFSAKETAITPSSKENQEAKIPESPLLQQTCDVCVKDAELTSREINNEAGYYVQNNENISEEFVSKEVGFIEKITEGGLETETEVDEVEDEKEVRNFGEELSFKHTSQEDEELIEIPQTNDDRSTESEICDQENENDQHKTTINSEIEEEPEVPMREDHISKQTSAPSMTSDGEFGKSLEAPQEDEHQLSNDGSKGRDQELNQMKTITLSNKPEKQDVPEVEALTEEIQHEDVNQKSVSEILSKENKDRDCELIKPAVTAESDEAVTLPHVNSIPAEEYGHTYEAINKQAHEQSDQLESLKQEAETLLHHKDCNVCINEAEIVLEIIHKKEAGMEEDAKERTDVKEDKIKQTNLVVDHTAELEFSTVGREKEEESEKYTFWMKVEELCNKDLLEKLKIDGIAEIDEAATDAEGESHITRTEEAAITLENVSEEEKEVSRRKVMEDKQQEFQSATSDEDPEIKQDKTPIEQQIIQSMTFKDNSMESNTTSMIKHGFKSIVSSRERNMMWKSTQAASQEKSHPQTFIETSASYELQIEDHGKEVENGDHPSEYNESVSELESLKSQQKTLNESLKHLEEEKKHFMIKCNSLKQQIAAFKGEEVVTELEIKAFEKDEKQEPKGVKDSTENETDSAVIAQHYKQWLQYGKNEKVRLQQQVRILQRLSVKLAKELGENREVMIEENKNIRKQQRTFLETDKKPELTVLVNVAKLKRENERIQRMQGSDRKLCQGKGNSLQHKSGNYRPLSDSDHPSKQKSTSEKRNSRRHK